MKAAVIHRQGGPEELTLADLPDPHPGPGQVRVAIRAAAVNPVDLKTRSGFLTDIALRFPAVLGWDLAGVVDQIGDSVTSWQVGDEAIAMIAQPVRGQGSYAQYIVIDATMLAPAPTGIDLTHAAALPLAGLTAWQALDALGVQSGAVLVTGGAGAVGSLAIQLAVARRLDVTAMVAKEDIEWALALGASNIVERGKPVPTLGVAGVLDTAGVADAITAVADGGAFVSIADTDQPGQQRGIIPRKSYVNEDGKRLARLSEQVSKKELTIAINSEFDLSEAAAAHRRFEQGGARGKILIVP